jgi:hypothetical protein
MVDVEWQFRANGATGHALTHPQARNVPADFSIAQ